MLRIDRHCLEMAPIRDEVRPDGRSNMKRTPLALMVGLAVGILSTSVSAAPPTVTPSPGYDARLREQQLARQRAAEPAAPSVQPAKIRRGKPKTQ